MFRRRDRAEGDRNGHARDSFSNSKSKITMKTLSELEEALPYEEAKDRAISTRTTIAQVKRHAALNRVRDREANPPLIKDLSQALKAESHALRKLGAARTAREAAAAVQDSWDVMIEQLTVLKDRCLRAEQQIEEARSTADALREQVAIELGGSGFVDVQVISGNVATVESAVPIMENALATIKADAENHVIKMRAFAEKHSVPREVVP
jgi:hypothetical protein